MMRTYAGVLAVLSLVQGCAEDGAPIILEVQNVDVSTPEDTALAVRIPTQSNRQIRAEIATPPSHGTLSDLGNGLYQYMPAENYTGPDTIAVTFDNGQKVVTGTANITVTPVNDAPVAGPDSFAAGFAQSLTILSSTLLGNDTDIDGGALTVSEAVSGSNGTAALVGGNVVFTPAAGFQGTATFSYRLSDGAASSLGSVVVAVGPNSAPVANNDSATIAEDGTLAVPAATVLLNDTDADLQTLAVSGAGTATHGTVVFSGTSLTFTPDANYNGPASFSYLVTDGAGTATGTVNVTVSAVNDAPTVVDDSGLVATEDEVLTLTKAQLLGNDADVDGDTLRIVSVGNAVNGTVALPSAVVGDLVTFTPTANYGGPASFDYTVSDGTVQVSGHVSLTVGGVNDAPVATDDALSSPEDQVFSIAGSALLANDTDVDGASLAITAVSGASVGTVSLAGSTVTFTPPANYSGPATFSYTISDGSLTDTATVTLTITAVNDAPVAVDDSATTAEDVPVMIAVLANDTDLEGDTLAVDSVIQPAHGVAAIVGTIVVYTPTANYAGPDSFTYIARDGSLTAMANVTINVTPVNDAPVAMNDAVTTNEDTAAAIDVLQNDVDPENALTVTTVSAPAHGTTTLIGGIVQYQPALNYFGPDSFQYTVSDGVGGQASATVSVTVVPVNDAPVAHPDGFFGTDTFTVPAPGVLVNDTDVDGPMMIAVLDTDAAYGTVTLDPNGGFTYTPFDSCNEVDSFTYHVTDGFLSSETVTVTLDINHAPVANDDPYNDPYNGPGFYNVAANETLSLPANGVLRNDADIDVGDYALLTAIVVSPPTSAVAFTLNADGSFSYTAGTQALDDSFTYVAWDGYSVSQPATVRIRVYDCGGQCDVYSNVGYGAAVTSGEVPDRVIAAQGCCYLAKPGFAAGGVCQSILSEHDDDFNAFELLAE